MPKKPNISDPVFQAGYRLGKEETTVTLLTYFQKRYMDRLVVRGSTLGKAILEVASDAAFWIKQGMDLDNLAPAKPEMTITVPEGTLDGK